MVISLQNVGLGLWFAEGDYLEYEYSSNKWAKMNLI